MWLAICWIVSLWELKGGWVQHLSATELDYNRKRGKRERGKGDRGIAVHGGVEQREEKGKSGCSAWSMGGLQTASSITALCL